DAKATMDILRETGAELVLHGHNHEQTVFEFDTVTGPAVIVGVPSASEAVAGRIPGARCNECRVAQVRSGWRCGMAGRAVADGAAKVGEGERRSVRESGG